MQSQPVDIPFLTEERLSPGLLLAIHLRVGEIHCSLTNVENGSVWLICRSLLADTGFQRAPVLTQFYLDKNFHSNIKAYSSVARVEVQVGVGLQLPQVRG